MKRQSEALSTYVIALAVVATGVAAALVLSGASVGNLWVVGCLAALGAAAERGSVKLSGGVEVSISLVPTLFAAATFGPLAAMAVAGASMLGDLRGPDERQLLKWLSYTSSRSITAAVVGLSANLLEDLVPSRIGSIVAVTFLGALLAESLDVLFVAATHRLRRKGSGLDIIQSLGPLALLAVPLYAPIVALLVVAYQTVSPWTLPLFAVPTVAAQRLHALYEAQRRLARDLTIANRHLERASLSFATALVTTLDARDQYTAGHSAAVAIYSRDIAHRMNLSGEHQQLAYVSGLVHDIGKIGLPAGLLEKPAALTPAEREHMEQHSVIGERILRNVEGYTDVAAIVRHHHEQIDGHGYPDRLAGPSIPLLARIIGVADAYNAMTSDRPYRRAMPTHDAQARLVQAAGTQFDIDAVVAFLGLLGEAAEPYKEGLRHDFRIPDHASLSEKLVAASV